MGDTWNTIIITQYFQQGRATAKTGWSVLIEKSGMTCNFKI